MTDATTPQFPDFDTMTPADFEHILPTIFENSSNGKVSSDPRLQKFLANNPDCAALVRDLEAIAEQARSLFNIDEEPGDDLWGKIASQMDADAALPPTEPEIK
jgi:hypothetical protein